MSGVQEAQPLSFKDFSGGLTDNFLQGDTTRYQRADNFLITVDRKLEERYGTTLYDPTGYSLGGSSVRVAGLFTGISESLLFAHTSRKLYTQTGGPNYGAPWAEILGPTGNEAIGGGTNYAQLTHGEFQRQIYYTTDAGILPGKIFRDQTNAWKAVTPGLPKMAFTPNFPSNASLLASCITLANTLSTLLQSHMNDSAQIGSGTSTTFQHKLVDKWSLSYLVAQTWTLGDTENPGPQPTPTPISSCSNAATLYQLCLALSLAYEHHRNDLGGAAPDTTTGARIYHQDIYYFPTGTVNPYGGTSGTQPSKLGINAKLTVSGIATTITQAATFLNDLAQKLSWHMFSPLSHSIDNNLVLMSRYLSTPATMGTYKISTIYTSSSTLQVNPNYNDFLAYAAWIKKAWNAHVANAGVVLTGAHTLTVSAHGQVDPYGTITLPDPTDFDSAALIIFWARWLYGVIHVYDSNVQTHNRTSFSAIAGSANITSVVDGAGAPLALPVGAWVIRGAWNDAVAGNRQCARVLSSPAPTAGTATLSRTASVSATYDCQYSTSWLHGALIGADLNLTSACDTTVYAAPAAEFLTAPGAIGTDLTTWIGLGTELLIALAAHEVNGPANIDETSSPVKSHMRNSHVADDLGGVSNITGNPFYVPSVVTYGYAAFYRYQYTVEPNGILYLDQGPPAYSTSLQTTPSYPVGTVIAAYNTTYFTSATIVVENPTVTISGIPSLVNTSTTNYDTVVSVTPQPTDPADTGYYSNLTIELYRTISGGTTFYFLDQLANLPLGATQSYSDVTNDTLPRPGGTLLIDREPMYTSGGVLANDPPPVCKFVHALGGFMYYGAVTDTGQLFPQRIRQSIQGEPDSAPADSFDDLEDEITGLSSSRNNLIAGCKNSVYRVSGEFTSTGQGSMTHERISDSIGCLSAKSMVKTEIGLFFAGSDGFYYTDGYQLIKISIDLDKTYRALTTSDIQKARIYGSYDKLTRRIWWAMQSQATGQDNDVFFVYYLDYGVKPSGVFTKCLTNSSWYPASATFFKGALVIGDSRGYLFKTDPATKTDPKVNVAVSPSLWTTVAMPYNFSTCAVDFGTIYKRKWVTRIHSIGQNVGNGSIQVVSVNDNNDTAQTDGTQNLPPIQYTANPTWGDATVIWGDATYDWKYDGKMDLWRRFPAGSMRSDLKQISYTPGNFVVYGSDAYPDFAFAQVDSTLKTATITTPTGYTSVLWPLDLVDMSISFDVDGYVNQYLITALDATHKIVTFADAGNLSVTGATYKWQITGVRKEQRIRITAFDIHFNYLGDENQAYPGQSGAGGFGANA